jgi:mRNA-degrading endonuclease toxin of MazEF toxin-antitoxin module
VRRGEIYRTAERVPERGGKPGFYVVVSRSFIAENEDIATVVCAPVYSGLLGLATEVAIGMEEGLPRTCSIRCDFLTLMFKSKLTGFVSTLVGPKLRDLNRALLAALELPQPLPGERKSGPIPSRRSSPGERRRG